MHTDTSHCLSARGELNDREFNFSCLQDFGGQRVDVTINNAWSLRCLDPTTPVEAHVTIPRQQPGAFEYGTDDQNGTNIAITLFNNTLNASSERANLAAAEIKGTVSMVGSAPALTGTFSASWTHQTDNGCDAGSCPKATIRASFRSVFDF
jgi:hypothetical protein